MEFITVVETLAAITKRIPGRFLQNRMVQPARPAGVTHKLPKIIPRRIEPRRKVFLITETLRLGRWNCCVCKCAYAGPKAQNVRSWRPDYSVSITPKIRNLPASTVNT